MPTTMYQGCKAAMSKVLFTVRPLCPSKPSHHLQAFVALFVHKALGWGHAGYLWRPGAGMVCPSGTEPDHSHSLHCRPAAPSLRPLQVNATPKVTHLHACTFLPLFPFLFFVCIFVHVSVDMLMLSHLRRWHIACYMVVPAPEWSACDGELCSAVPLLQRCSVTRCCLSICSSDRHAMLYSGPCLCLILPCLSFTLPCLSLHFSALPCFSLALPS